MKKPKAEDGEKDMKRTKPQLTAEIMRPEHPRWSDFCSRLTEEFKGEAERQGKGEFVLTIRHILEQMAFTQFDIELTLLYLFRRFVLTVSDTPSQPIADQYDNS